MVLMEEKCLLSLLLLLLLLQRSVITYQYITLSQEKITFRTTIKNDKNFQVSDNIIMCIYYCMNRLPSKNTCQGSIFHPGLCCWYGSWVHDSFQGLEINVNGTS